MRILKITTSAGAFGSSACVLHRSRLVSVLCTPALEWIAFAGVTPPNIGPLMAEGVPGAGFRVDGSRYFWYHHTAADTADKLDAGEVQRAVAAMAVFAYVVAEMPRRLPR